MNNQYSQDFQHENNRRRRSSADEQRRTPWREDNFTRGQNRFGSDEQQGAYGLQRSSQDYGEASYGQGGQGGGNYDDYYRDEHSAQQGGASWNQGNQNYGPQNYGGHERDFRNQPQYGESQRWGQRPGREWQQGGQGYGGNQFGHRQSTWSGGQTGIGSSAGDTYGAQPYNDDFGSSYGRGSSQSGQSSQTAGNFGTQQTSHRGKGPKGYMRADERIREELCECLSDDPHIDASEISVEVKDGVVTLEGSVQERAQKHRVEDIADRCSGVKDVHNGLRVTQQASSQGGDKAQDKLGSKTH